MSEGFSRVSSKGVIFTHTTGPGNTSSRWFLDWIKNTFFLLKNSNGLSSKAFSAWLIQDDKTLKGSSPPISWRIYFDGCWPPLCAHFEFSSAFPFIFYRGVTSCCFSRPGRKWLARMGQQQLGWWWRHAAQNTKTTTAISCCWLSLCSSISFTCCNEKMQLDITWAGYA